MARVLRTTAVLGLLLASGCAMLPAIPRHLAASVELAPPGRPARTFHYSVYLPNGYTAPENADRRWPLLVHLPGCWSHGDHLRFAGRAGLIRELESGRELPMVVVTPLPPGLLERWSPADLVAFIDHATQRFRTDPDRVYGTAVSLSAAALWETAIAYPDRIAAIAPVAGWGNPETVARMVDVAVWAFHGSLDPMVPAPLHRRMIEALRRAGGSARWTLFPGDFHEIWNRVYAMDELYEWLLAQRRPPPQPSRLLSAGARAQGPPTAAAAPR